MGIIDTLLGRKQISVADAAGHAILASSPPPSQVAIDSPGTPGKFDPFATDGLTNFVTGLGTHRDKSTHNRYMPGVFIDRITADAMFGCSWLSRRLVTTIADDMVRKWRKVKWDGMDKGAAAKGLPAITAEEKRVFLRKRIHQGIKWGRMYGGSIVVMMIKGQANAAAMAQPLEVDKLGKGCLLGLLVFDRWRVYGMPPDKVAAVTGQGSVDASIVAPYLNQSLGDPNFGLPEFYFLADSAVRVHHSRCIRFNGEELPWYEWMRNALWDDSVYRNVMPAVQNYDSVIKGGATLITEASQDVISAEGVWDRMGDNEGTAQVTRRYQLLAAMKSMTHMLVLDKDKETYARVPAQFSGIAQMQDKAGVDVSGAFDIPMTRLFGQSPGGLNSTGDSDLQNYDDHITARRELDLAPQIDKIDQVLVRSALGYMPENFQSEFQPLRQLDQVQASQVRKNKADADKIWFDMGVATEGLIARERSNDGSFDTMEEEDVKMAKELGEANYDKELEDIKNPPEPVVPAAFGAKPGDEGAANKGEQDEEDPAPEDGKKPAPVAPPKRKAEEAA